jgi:hypothetical protein
MCFVDCCSENNQEAAMNLRKRALGLSLGVVWGLMIFVWTVLATMRGKGEFLIKISAYYLGFTVSYLGSLVGLVWGFVHGFILGVLIAWLYDLFCKMLYKSETASK